MSRADKLTSTVKKDLIYSDFLLNLDKHPLNGGLARVINEDSVKQSIKNLILTEIFERPYQPQLGSKLYSLLFEPMNDMTVNLMRNTITDTIRLYEPRARVLGVDIFPVDERNEYNVNITFSLINTIGEIQLDLIIKRIR
jgi:phage baseplate assembly protein W